MAQTRATIRSSVRDRLKDPSPGTVWTDTELNGYIDKAIESLYPSFFQRTVATTVAAAGPIQTAPATARNIYLIGHQRVGSTRVRPMRGWVEGNTQAHVPKVGITGDTLVWCWTTGWSAPALDTDDLTFPTEAIEVVVLRSTISALEALLADKVSAQTYTALQVRAQISEDDVVNALDALHATLRDRLSNVIRLPEVKQ